MSLLLRPRANKRRLFGLMGSKKVTYTKKEGFDLAALIYVLSPKTLQRNYSPAVKSLLSLTTLPYILPLELVLPN